MTRGLAVVIGMTIAYTASFAGMIFAYIYYKKRKKTEDRSSLGVFSSHISYSYWTTNFGYNPTCTHIRIIFLSYIFINSVF